MLDKKPLQCKPQVLMFPKLQPYKFHRRATLTDRLPSLAAHLLRCGKLVQLELIAAVLSTRRRKMFLSYPTLHPSLDLDLVISLDYHPGPSEARRINYSVEVKVTLINQVKNFIVF